MSTLKNLPPYFHTHNRALLPALGPFPSNNLSTFFTDHTQTVYIALLFSSNSLHRESCGIHFFKFSRRQYIVQMIPLWHRCQHDHIYFVMPLIFQTFGERPQSSFYILSSCLSSKRTPLSEKDRLTIFRSCQPPPSASADCKMLTYCF